MQKKAADLGYNVLGIVFFGIIVFMGAAILFNLYQDFLTKH
jgi:hypothetical protein